MKKFTEWLNVREGLFTGGTKQQLLAAIEQDGPKFLPGQGPKAAAIISGVQQKSPEEMTDVEDVLHLAQQRLQMQGAKPQPVGTARMAMLGKAASDAPGAVQTPLTPTTQTIAPRRTTAGAGRSARVDF